MARKGLLYLLRAWIKDIVPLGQLTIMGTRTNIQDSTIQYLDWIPDDQVPGTYRDHSVFCLPSLEEGQALAVLEAMASALPVVITRETGVPITDGDEGLYVPVRDEAAIRKTLEYLKDDPQLREKMGKRGRDFALKRPWSLFGDQVVRVLEDLA